MLIIVILMQCGMRIMKNGISCIARSRKISILSEATEMASIETLTEMASYLYDGGWRAVDLEMLKSEYGLDDESASIICGYLKSFESGSY